MPDQSPAQRYDDSALVYDQLHKEAAYTIEYFLTTAEIKFHSVSSRLKQRASFLAKAQSEDGVEREISDLAGVRVVCLYLSDLKRVKKVILDNFIVVEEDDKIDALGVDSFGYMSIHFLLRFTADMAGPRYDALRGLTFELQVRTILMDAWANVSHHLDYKGAGSIPANLRRDFNALSGLFYVADTQFEMFAAESGRVASQDRLAVNRGQRDLDVNRDTVEALVLSHFPNREHRASKRDFADFADELMNIGLQNLNDVDSAIKAGLRDAEDEDRERTARGDGVFWDIGMARTAVSHAVPGFSDLLMKRFEDGNE